LNRALCTVYYCGGDEGVVGCAGEDGVVVFELLPKPDCPDCPNDDCPNDDCPDEGCPNEDWLDEPVVEFGCKLFVAAVSSEG